MLLQRLYPEPGEVEAAELHSRLDLGARAPAERPYLVLNMVASLDGKATLGGVTRELSGKVDRALFHQLRTQADAVMAGAGTVRIERYGRPIKRQELRDKRVAEGLAPDPLMVVVSERLRLQPELPCLQDPETSIVVVTGAAHELEGVRADVRYLRTGDDVAAMLAALREDYGVRSILCEGGPTLNYHLLAADAVDELFLCTSPQLVGGVEALTIVAGMPLDEPRRADLVWLLQGGGELFARCRIRHP